MSKKVLIVEDEKGFREILSEFLEAYGFEVSAASDGEEGFQRYKDGQPDIILADVLLPKVNGFQMCDSIRKSPGGDRTPIVLMSALYKTAKIQKDSRDKYGIADYLVKPLNLKETASKLARILGVTKEQLIEGKNHLTEDRRFAAEQAAPVPSHPSGPIPDAPETGDLSVHSPSAALLTFYRRNLTGITTFEAAGATKKVYLRNGEVIYATSTKPQENYAQLLIADGLLTGEQFEGANTKAKANGLLVGKVLTADGFIEEKTLSEYLIREVNVRLDDLLKWKTGRYDFERDESFIGKIKRPSMRVLNFIYGYCRTGGLDDLFRARYENRLDAVVMKSEDRLRSVSEVEWKGDDLLAIALADGRMSVKGILEESGMSRAQFFRVLGLLEYAGVFHLV